MVTHVDDDIGNNRIRNPRHLFLLDLNQHRLVHPWRSRRGSPDLLAVGRQLLLQQQIHDRNIPVRFRHVRVHLATDDGRVRPRSDEADVLPGILRRDCGLLLHYASVLVRQCGGDPRRCGRGGQG